MILIHVINAFTYVKLDFGVTIIANDPMGRSRQPLVPNSDDSAVDLAIHGLSMVASSKVSTERDTNWPASGVPHEYTRPVPTRLINSSIESSTVPAAMKHVGNGCSQTL